MLRKGKGRGEERSLTISLRALKPGMRAGARRPDGRLHALEELGRLLRDFEVEAIRNDQRDWA